MKKIAILVLAAFLLTLLPAAALAKPDPDKAKGNKWVQQQLPGKYDKGQSKDSRDRYYKDVDFDDIHDCWANGYIKKAARKGLVEGYQGKYQPNQPVTNLELIVMLVRALDKDGQIDLDKVDTSSAGMDLKKIPSWGQVYVAAAVDYGIILPEELKNFNPNQGCKRYQVALYIARILNQDDNDVDIDFDELAADVDDIIDIMEQLGDLGEDNDEIQDSIDSLIADLEDFNDELADADEDDLSALISDVKALANSLDEIIADAEDEDVDEDILDELGDAAQKISALKKALKAYQDRDLNDSFLDDNQFPYDCKSSIKKVKRYRIMIGDNDGKFSPMRVVKRDEIATLLTRLTDLILGEFDIASAKGTLEAVEDEDDGYVITVLNEDGEEDDYNVTGDTRILYNKKSVSLKDLEDYLGYEIVVVYDVDNDASTIKIISSSAADDDDDDDD
ncbi:MAG TPA: hypothetical protein DER60_02360, partial [Syntrophomonas sp.]|nr:hypothetical protein [Syntrophomonas sp.]